MAKSGTLTEFCCTSFASQSHDPVEINCVDQALNTNDQESDFDDNQQTGTSVQQDEYESFDNEFEDSIHKNASESDN